MPLPSPSFTPPSSSRPEAAGGPAVHGERMVERRGRSNGAAPLPPPGLGTERRQFGSSHQGLSDAGRELAQAIDRYKLENHRRYITCDEMLAVLHGLGYQRVST